MTYIYCLQNVKQICKALFGLAAEHPKYFQEDMTVDEQAA